MSRAHDTEIETMGVNRVELLGSVIADDIYCHIYGWTENR